jgi:putative two-component system response regulator
MCLFLQDNSMKEVKTQHTALIVDDDEQVGSFLSNLLKMEKINSVSAVDAESAIELIKTNKYIDLFIIDYYLPDKNGNTVIEFIKSAKPYAPIIAMTGGANGNVTLTSLIAGANFVLGKPINPAEFLMIVRNLISLSDAYDRLKDAENIIEALSSALEARDSYTEGHSKRVASLSLDLYDALGLNDRGQKEGLYIGCILHDIGKIGVPDSILKSVNRLTPEEFQTVKKHPCIGFEICQKLTNVEGALDVILHHHERLDGSGYPDGLDDGSIPVLAQIAAIADVYDALTSKRSYRNEVIPEMAIEELEKEAESGKLNKEFISTFKKLTLIQQ